MKKNKNIKIVPQDTLSALLDNESFVRWLTNSADEIEKKKWEDWLEKDSTRATLVKRAKKFLTIPFKKVEEPDVEVQLNKFRILFSKKFE